MSRLDFAPNIKEIRVTDIKKGLAVFTPKPERPVSFAALLTALKKAGYTLESADVTVEGTLDRDAGGWALVVDGSNQRFELRGGRDLATLVTDPTPGDRLEVTGALKSAAGSTDTIELVTATRSTGASASVFALPDPGAIALATIRTTSPGLTVYKGGAVTPHYTYTRQHLGPIEVGRHGADVAVSYTPTSTVQLAVDLPVSHTWFRDGSSSGEGQGFGNLTVWAKYRFFRTLETWGDRQASVRFGVELPTGHSEAPNESALAAPAFVREQLTPIDGGLSAHVDLTYSQAHGRLVFGGNVEGVLRGERDGYRLGHEIRANTDLEYVLFPLKYDRPTKELFAIVETTLVRRWTGHVGGIAVPGSRSTELFVAPGLEYVAGPRVAFEASLQLPVVRNTGPLVLRTDRNLIVGVKLLF